MVQLTPMMTAMMPSQQVTTVRHSSMNWRRFSMEPMANSSMGTDQLAAEVRPALSMMSAGRTPDTNRIRNNRSVTNTAEILALVTLATMSPTAKRASTMLNQNNISTIFEFLLDFL